MTKLLIKLFVKDYKETDNGVVRGRYGLLSSVVGIIINLLLATFKIIVGALFSMVSITASGFDNLTDCGSNIVSLISFRVSAKPADREHPFGHARIEYIASMIVAMLICVLGIELIISSAQKIFEPVAMVFQIIMIVSLGVSILFKIWLFFFYRKISKTIDSEVLRAAATDSLSDCLTNAAVIVSILISHFSGFNLDGYIGLAVAVVVIIAGIKIFKTTMNELLGEAPTKETIRKIKDIIFSHTGVFGVHDMIVHNYGPSRTYASVHVEVDADKSILESHDLIDVIEREISNKLKINAVIHMDPIVIDDPEVNTMRETTRELVRSVDNSYSVHDFRMVKGITHTNLIFDVAIPFESKAKEENVMSQIDAKIKEISEDYFTVITVERQVGLEEKDN
ncbi:MAG: cation diffusion facilitator family transporter [Clostridia bacterium]